MSTGSGASERLDRHVESSPDASSSRPDPLDVPAWACSPRERPPRHYRLEVVESDGHIAKEVDVFAQPYYIFGRAPDCDVVLDHPSASRRHAALVYGREGEVRLNDLGSVNGTFLEGEALKSGMYRDVRIGDRMRFGCCETVYVLRGEKESTSAVRDETRDGKRALVGAEGAKFENSTWTGSRPSLSSETMRERRESVRDGERERDGRDDESEEQDEDLDEDQEASKRDALDLDMIADYLGCDAMDDFGEDEFYDRTLRRDAGTETVAMMIRSDSPETFETTCMKRRLVEQYASELHAQVSQLDEKIQRDRERRLRVQEEDTLDAYMSSMSDTLEEEKYAARKVALLGELSEAKVILDQVAEKLRPVIQGVGTTRPDVLARATSAFRAKLQAKIREIGFHEKPCLSMLPPAKRFRSAPERGQRDDAPNPKSGREPDQEMRARPSGTPAFDEASEGDLEEWTAPSGQTGDGRTSLNDKYGY